MTRKLPAGSGLALDLGGRHGELADQVEGLGYTYVNVDIVPVKPPMAVQGNAERLPFAGASFNLVTSFATLEHFEQPWAALAEARRVLTPGGRLVLTVPWMHPFHTDDLWRFSPLGLRRLLETAGFDVDVFEPQGGLITAMAATVGSRFQRYGNRLIKLGRKADRFALRFGGGNGEATAHQFYVVAIAA